jgi:preprotein translocase subunit SecG
MLIYYVLVTGYILVCFLLLLVVLLQQGKGGDIAAAFGGGGSQTAFGARAGATVLTRASTVLGTLFMLGSLLLAMWTPRGPASVIRGVPPGPLPQQEAPAVPPQERAPDQTPEPPPPDEPPPDR